MSEGDSNWEWVSHQGTHPEGYFITDSELSWEFSPWIHIVDGINDCEYWFNTETKENCFYDPEDFDETNCAWGE